MAEEKRHHHLFHHNKDGENPAEVDPRKAEKRHHNLELLGEAGAVAAGAFALHEKHKAKKDPENAHKHKIEEEIAATMAVGSAGFVFHEHHEKKELKKEVKSHHY